MAVLVITAVVPTVTVTVFAPMAETVPRPSMPHVRTNSFVLLQTVLAASTSTVPDTEFETPPPRYGLLGCGGVTAGLCGASRLS